jgi:thiol-disulfide isomerase/thioredoxin
MSTISAIVLFALCAADADTVLVQFHSTKCGPCRAMHPVVQQLTDSGYPLQQIDVDQQPQYAEQFKVRSLPTFALFARGREVSRVEGSSNFNELSQLFHTVGFRPNGVQTAAQPAPAAATQAGYAQQPPSQQPATQEVQFTSTQAPANSEIPAIQHSPQQIAGWATVRLKVEDAQFTDYGTGTIIDCHGDEALVLTCGHIFRQSKGKAKITVDLFAPGATKPVEGFLIRYEAEERDIALVSIRPGIAIQPVPVAPAGYSVQPRDRVFTIGCDKGNAPSLLNSVITPNRYMGAPRFTAEGAPVEGRSGGGLFTESGYLIGVCNSANAKENHGLYAALPTVHWQLDQSNLSAIYQGKPAANVAQASLELPAAPPAGNQPPAPISQNQFANAAPPLPSMPPAMPRGLAAAAPVAPPAGFGVSPVSATSPAADDSEVIVIVRSRSNPTKQSEIFMLDRPPAEVIRMLQAEARPALRGSSEDLLRSAAGFGNVNGPVVRGQSQ